MRKSLFSVLLAVGLLVAGVATAGARGSFGFNGGLSVGSLILEGVGTGLGPDAVNVNISADAVFKVECINNGSNFAAGVNYVSVGAIVNEDFPPLDKNGKVIVDLTLEDPDPPEVTSDFCKNDNWTASVVNGVDHWENVVVTLEHTSRTIIQHYDCADTGLGEACTLTSEDVIEF